MLHEMQENALQLLLKTNVISDHLYFVKTENLPLGHMICEPYFFFTTINKIELITHES